MAEKDATINVLVIGGSAGALEVILQFLPRVREDIAFALVIVLHRSAESDSSLDQLLALHSLLPVKEIEDKMRMSAGTVYLVPADYHVLFDTGYFFSLDVSEKVNYSRPSIDVVFESAAECFGRRCAGLLLSGGNADGSLGLQKIAVAGGVAAVQLPSSAKVPYMPQQAIENLVGPTLLKPSEMAFFINDLDGGKPLIL